MQKYCKSCKEIVKIMDIYCKDSQIFLSFFFFFLVFRFCFAILKGHLARHSHLTSIQLSSSADLGWLILSWLVCKRS